MKKHINKYGINEVIESTKISIDQYFKGDDENIPKVINYIPKICANRQKQKDNPYLYKCNYIKAIIRNRLNLYNEWRVDKALKAIVINQEEYEYVCDLAKYSKNWTEFWEEFNSVYEGDW